MEEELPTQESIQPSRDKDAHLLQPNSVGCTGSTTGRKIKEASDEAISTLETELYQCRLQLHVYQEVIGRLQKAVRKMEQTITEAQQNKSGDVQQDSRMLCDLVVSSAEVPATPEFAGQAETSERSKFRSFKTVSGPQSPSKFYKGTSTFYLNSTYFSPSGSTKIFMYNLDLSEWSTLPECPQSYFALAVINGAVTAIGGRDRQVQPSNSLLSCIEDETNCKFRWTAHFPPMPSKRIYPTAVCCESSLVVAGGETTWISGYLTTVEIMNTETLQWSSASSLPKAVRGASVTVCRDTLYLLGGWDHTGNTVLACPLSTLLHSCTTASRGSVSTHNSRNCNCNAWYTIADAPVSQSTCATLNGNLIAAGGRDSRGRPTSTIYMYDLQTDSWIPGGDLSSPRYHCLAVSCIGGEELIVAGGLEKGGYATNKVDRVFTVKSSAVV